MSANPYEKLSLEQLKARAYDMVATIEGAQAQLRELNEEIAKRLTTSQKPPVENQLDLLKDAKPVEEKK